MAESKITYLEAYLLNDICSALLNPQINQKITAEMKAKGDFGLGICQMRFSYMLTKNFGKLKPIIVELNTLKNNVIDAFTKDNAENAKIIAEFESLKATDTSSYTEEEVAAHKAKMDEYVTKFQLIDADIKKEFDEIDQKEASVDFYKCDVAFFPDLNTAYWPNITLIYNFCITDSEESQA